MSVLSKSNSLLRRLVLRISFVSIASIVMLSTIVYTQIDHTLEALRVQTVQEQAKNIASYLKPAKRANRVYLDMPNDLRQFYAKMADTYQYIVRDGDGNRLMTSPVAFADFYPDEFTSLGNGMFEFTGPSGRQFTGYTMQGDVQGRAVYVQVAQAQGAADAFSDEITDTFMRKLFWVGIPFYCGLLIVIVWTVRHGLKPLQHAADEVAKMDVSDLSLRLDEKSVPSEALPLVQSINFSFARLEKSILEQKELTENMAHELRTPLTILKTRIDTLDRSGQTVKLSQDVDTMIKLVNQMLDVTRLEYADTMEKKNVDLAEVLSQACQDFFPLFIRAQRELRVSGIDKPAIIQGNKDIIYRAICNLLDNALEYSPANTPVDAALEGRVIRITDHGKAIPEAQRKLIFRRFHKDRSPTARKSGAGLGLSIVTKTMELHGGYADVEPARDAEGNSFRMVFDAPDGEV